MTNSAFTHAGVITRYRTKSLYKSIFVLSKSRDISLMKRIESLLKIAGMKFEFLNLKISFHKRLVSFLAVKTVKCKRGIKAIENRVSCELAISFHSKWLSLKNVIQDF